jgi:hypothetical protein
MVPPAGKETRAAQLRPLNLPRPVRVKTDARGAPAAVFFGGRPLRVREIRDRWRIDDLWWREPVCRVYFELELEGGRITTLFHDPINNAWCEQGY